MSTGSLSMAQTPVCAVEFACRLRSSGSPTVLLGLGVCSSASIPCWVLRIASSRSWGRPPTECRARIASPSAPSSIGTAVESGAAARSALSTRSTAASRSAAPRLRSCRCRNRTVRPTISSAQPGGQVIGGRSAAPARCSAVSRSSSRPATRYRSTSALASSTRADCRRVGMPAANSRNWARTSTVSSSATAATSPAPPTYRS